MIVAVTACFFFCLFGLCWWLMWKIVFKPWSDDLDRWEQDLNRRRKALEDRKNKTP